MARISADEVITGERIQALAGLTLLPDALAVRTPGAERFPSVRFLEHRDIGDDDIRRLSRASSIFVYALAVPLFQRDVWPRLEGDGHVVITHNGDAEVGPAQAQWADAQGERLATWFAQNLTVEHPKLVPVPIGLANSSWPHGDVKAIAGMGDVERTGLLHARFDVGTHADRRRAADAVRDAFPAIDPPGGPPQPFRDYLGDLARHRFCACPRGNGVDTHRFWECHYLGVVPVVERSAHSEVWERRGLPMVVLDDWSELSRERLEAESAETPAERPPLLRMSHYSARIPH